jgi:predicted RNase H-like HicB family nuclease
MRCRGRERQEGLRLIREAIPMHLESLREQGNSTPEPISGTELVES